MNKADQHEAIRARAATAIRNLYHNATPSYPRLDTEEAERFQGWFEGAVEFEIEYIKGGGAYGHDFLATLRAPCNAGKYKSALAREYYVRMGRRAMVDERRGYAMWEWISNYGELYTWGRGGRTLAPDKLVRTGGSSSFSMLENYCDGLSLAETVELIRIVESFNRYVEAWCEGVPEMWAEYVREEKAQADAEQQEREYWAQRDVITAPGYQYN